MAVISDPFTGTDLAGFIPEIWPGMVLEELFAKAVAARWFTDLSEYMRNEGDIGHVADVFTNTFTKQTQSTQGAEITTAGPAQVDVTLNVNTHDYVAYIIGDKDARQLGRSFDFNMVYTKKSAGVLRHALEDALLGLWSGLSTNVVGDTATVLSDAEIRVGINALEAANFDTLDGDVAFFFHPLESSGCKILSNWLGTLYETTRRKLNNLFNTVNDLTRELLAAGRCESLNLMAT